VDKPRGIAITPDGRPLRDNYISGSVTPIELAANKPAEITWRRASRDRIAPTARPPTSRTSAGLVTPIELATNKAGPEITVGPAARDRDTPDGTPLRHQRGSDSVTPVELATTKPARKSRWAEPSSRITPDGKTARHTSAQLGDADRLATKKRARKSRAAKADRDRDHPAAAVPARPADRTTGPSGVTEGPDPRE